MRLLSFLIAILFLFYSCKKTEVQASDTLTSHPWTLSQSRIVAVDTTTIMTYVDPGKPGSVSSSYRKDTSYNLSDCIRQSTYSFSQNGISHITDNCFAGQPITDTPWAILPNKILQIVFVDDVVGDVYISKIYSDPLATGPPSNGFSVVQNGIITQMSSSAFTVDQISTADLTFGYFVNGVMVDSVVKIQVDRYYTFTSR